MQVTPPQPYYLPLCSSLFYSLYGSDATPENYSPPSPPDHAYTPTADANYDPLHYATNEYGSAVHGYHGNRYDRYSDYGNSAKDYSPDKDGRGYGGYHRDGVYHGYRDMDYGGGSYERESTSAYTKDSYPTAYDRCKEYQSGHTKEVTSSPKGYQRTSNQDSYSGYRKEDRRYTSHDKMKDSGYQTYDKKKESTYASTYDGGSLDQDYPEEESYDQSYDHKKSHDRAYDREESYEQSYYGSESRSHTYDREDSYDQAYDRQNPYKQAYDRKSSFDKSYHRKNSYDDDYKREDSFEQEPYDQIYSGKKSAEISDRRKNSIDKGYSMDDPYDQTYSNKASIEKSVQRKPSLDKGYSMEDSYDQPYDKIGSVDKTLDKGYPREDSYEQNYAPKGSYEDISYDKPIGSTYPTKKRRKRRRRRRKTPRATMLRVGTGARARMATITSERTRCPWIRPTHPTLRQLPPGSTTWTTAPSTSTRRMMSTLWAQPP